MGIHIEGIEDVYMFLLIILFSELGKNLDENPMGGYSCPVYCEVDHQHFMEINGHISNTRTLRDTCSSNDSLWVLYMETESVDSE